MDGRKSKEGPFWCGVVVMGVKADLAAAAATAAAVADAVVFVDPGADVTSLCN